MKIIQVSTHDLWGGASLAAHRLNAGLRSIGQESTMYVANCKGPAKDVVRFVPPRDFGSRVSRTLRRKSLEHSLDRYAKSRPASSELFSDDRSQHGDAPLRQVPACDILNFHWISEFFDSGSMFGATSGRTRYVWTLHDMNPFTGGCHYDAGCQKHRRSCGSCPQLGDSREDDLSRQIWNRRRDAYSRLSPTQLQLVAPSRWMAGQIEQSALLGRFPVSVIPNGVDLDVFAPRNKSFAREALGLPQDANVLLFAGHTIDERRKGFSVLLEALAGLREERNLHLLAVGGYSAVPQLGIPYHPLGYISNERLLSIVYSAADLCVVPTLQDNLPNITIESLACGTPVVGFEVGGMSDVVTDGQTGRLVPTGNAAALREGIRTTLADPETRAAMSANCRRVAVAKFSIERQAREYLDLYESLAGRAGSIAAKR